jgi:hypothetical protein
VKGRGKGETGGGGGERSVGTGAGKAAAAGREAQEVWDGAIMLLSISPHSPPPLSLT